MTTTAKKLAPAPVWNLDPSHSSATFSIRHLMISKVRGEFAKLEGQVTLDPQRPEDATVTASIDVASISTREEKRDAHLKSADFFDAARFPKIRFESRSIRRDGDELKVDGVLTIRDVTRPVTLTVEGPSAPQTDPWGHVRVGASATTRIKRSEFGITWNAALETGGVVVGDEVTIQLDVSLVRA